MTPRPGMHITADTDVLRPSRVLEAGVGAALFAVLTPAMFAALVRELRTERRAVRYLVRLAQRTGTPIAVNIDTGAGTSTTVVIPPKDWTQERLVGFTAGFHEELEAAFGPGTLRQPEAHR